MARGLLLGAFLGVLLACPPAKPEHREVRAENGSVRIPAPLVGDGRVHFFTFRSRSGLVDFLVRTDGAGRLHAHLDACFSCYRYREGFFVEEGKLVCRACRLEYAIEDEVWEHIGACAPIGLRSTTEAGALVIAERDLERASRYFP